MPEHDDLTPSQPSQSQTVRVRTAYADGAPFRKPKRAPFLHRAVPISEELPKYRPKIAQRDVVAGLTVASLALPAAMAYAELAGLSAVHGLYALLLPAVVYAVLGSSKQLVIGPGGLARRDHRGGDPAARGSRQRAGRGARSDALVTGLRRDGVRLVMAKLKRAPKRVFDESGLTDTIGAFRFYPSIGAAVEACTSAGGARR